MCINWKQLLKLFELGIQLSMCINWKQLLKLFETIINNYYFNWAFN